MRALRRRSNRPAGNAGGAEDLQPLAAGRTASADSISFFSASRWSCRSALVMKQRFGDQILAPDSWRPARRTGRRWPRRSPAAGRSLGTCRRERWRSAHCRSAAAAWPDARKASAAPSSSDTVASCMASRPGSPAPGAAPGPESRPRRAAQDGPERVQPRRQVADRQAGLGGLAVRCTRDRHQPAGALDDRVVGRTQPPGPGLAEARDARRRPARVTRGEGLVAEPSRSMTPGRKFSTSTSARCSIACSSSGRSARAGRARWTPCRD